MYIENKEGLVEGAQARIGWVSFSKSGRTIYYKGRTLSSIGRRGIRGNFIDAESGEEFWVSGIKRRGSNAHPHASVAVVIDDDAREEYFRIRAGLNQTSAAADKPLAGARGRPRARRLAQ